MKMMRNWAGLFLIINLSVSCCYGVEEVSFPGKMHEIFSPTGKYKLINVDADIDKDVDLLGGNHALFVQDDKKSYKKKLLSYDRFVNVFWSPSDEVLAINDHENSNYTSCCVYVLDENKAIDLGVEAQKITKNGDQIFKQDHLRVEAIKWLDKNSLKFEVGGYGGESVSEIDLYYLYVVGKGVQKLK
jgi:hypothetical protein